MDVLINHIGLINLNGLNTINSKMSFFVKFCKQFGEHIKAENFTILGFSNWKNVPVKLQRHEDSEAHSSGVIKSLLFENKKESVITSLFSRHALVANENTKNLKIIIKLVLFCARQGLAFRGHDETKESSNKGNFIELIELVSSFIQSLFDFANREKNANYISKTIQNEIIDILAKEVRITISL